MTREEAINLLDLQLHGTPEQIEQYSSYEHATAIRMAIEALKAQPCEDAVSRSELKRRLQEHHDFFVNAYGGFSNMPLNDKARVDEITNCIAEVVNMPSVQQERHICKNCLHIHDNDCPIAWSKSEYDFCSFWEVDMRGERNEDID